MLLPPVAGCNAAEASPPPTTPTDGQAIPLLTHTPYYSAARAALLAKTIDKNRFLLHRRIDHKQLSRLDFQQVCRTARTPPAVQFKQ